MYGEPAPAPVSDPYADSYNPTPAPGAAPAEVPHARGRSRSRSPGRATGDAGYRSPYARRPSPAGRRGGAVEPKPTEVLGVFGLSIRTVERDLDEEFSKFGRVEKVTIVYDQRSDRSRGFGFIRMASVAEATRCIQELNGIELNGRRIRVDYSITDRPHAPTPGEYMGHRRPANRDYRDSYSSRGYYARDSYDRDYRSLRGGYDRYDRDRDPYGRDSRDWRDRRSPAPRGGRYSPDYRRRSYSRSPPRGSSPHDRRDYGTSNGDHRW